MASGTAGARWRRPLAALIVTSGATLAWTKARRRQLPGSMPRSWSELAPSPPASLRPEAPEPVTAREAPEPVTARGRSEPAADGPMPGPYPGSVLPLADGSAPSEEYVVKGNAGSMRSHAAGSPYFGRTRAQVWFRTQEEAAAAGFAPWTPKR